MANNWTREQLLVALGLYCELPFGQLHKGNPRIIQVAELLGRTPSALSMKLCNFASLDPVITSSGRSGLAGASALDKSIWKEFHDNTGHIMPAIEQELASLGVPHEDDEEFGDSVKDEESYYAANKSILGTRREGQNLFRKAVLSAFEFRCCVTGISDSRLLVASHIKPWSADEKNRLNPHNGLCLSTFFDRAFDIGLISFSESFEVMVSPELEEQAGNKHIYETFIARRGDGIALPSKFSPNPEFMEWHRRERFKTKAAQ